MFITSPINHSKNSPKKSDIPTPIIIPEIDDDGVKVIESEYHTLFVSDQDAILKEFQTVDDGEQFTAVREIIPKHKKYTLYIDSFAHDKNSLHKIINELRGAKDYDILEIRISSNGGYVSEGITLYNTMRECFNGRCETYLDSVGYSMGAMLFSLGDVRVIYEDSSLMYHNFSTGYMGKGDEIKSYIDFEDKHFKEFFTDKIVKQGFMSLEEYAQMKIGKDFWLNPIEMANRNISTHVIVSGFRLDNEAFIKFYNQEKPIDGWVEEQLTQMAEKEGAEEEAELAKKSKRTKKKPTPKKEKEEKKPKPVVKKKTPPKKEKASKNK